MAFVFIKQRDTCVHAIVITRLDIFYMQNDVTIRLSSRGEHGQDQDWISCRILAIILDQDWIWIFILEKNWIRTG